MIAAAIVFVMLAKGRLRREALLCAGFRVARVVLAAWKSKNHGAIPHHLFTTTMTHQTA